MSLDSRRAGRGSTGGPRGEAGSPGWDPYIGAVKLLGGAAWFVSGAGIACADPSGRALRGGEWFSGVTQSHDFGAATNPFVPIAALGKDLYAVRGNTYGAQPGDVIRVTTPAACWEGPNSSASSMTNRPLWGPHKARNFMSSQQPTRSQRFPRALSAVPTWHRQNARSGPLELPPCWRAAPARRSASAQSVSSSRPVVGGKGHVALAEPWRRPLRGARRH
jgi:hypothetical protein